jgi:UDP-N-acetylmuramoyl-tripeptide--D-alanyl-D-alanine ligase
VYLLFTVKEITVLTGAELINRENKELLDSVITNVDFDARRLTMGGLFVALPNGATDGHQYIDQAIQNGAVAVLISDASYCNNSYSKEIAFLSVKDTILAFQELASSYRLLMDKPVIGITGSNGKTTTKDMVAHLLSKKYNVHKTTGNYNNHLGLPLTLLQVRPHHEVVVLEMGMNHAGEMDVLGFIAKPDHVIITNIGESHIEHLGSRLGIAKAKGEVLHHIRPNGTALLPLDTEFLELLSSKVKGEKVFFGTDTYKNKIHNNSIHKNISASNIKISRSGTSFFYRNENNETLFCQIPLFGQHNVQNALSAIFLSKKLGLTNKEVLSALHDITISPMRFELISGKNDTTIINDSYNASPTSMITSSQTFIDIFSEQRRLLVLGDMYELGDDTTRMHQQIGLELNNTQEGRNISNAFNGRSRHFETKQEAINFLQQFLQKDFAFFFKASRGMKLEDVVKPLSL